MEEAREGKLEEELSRLLQAEAETEDDRWTITCIQQMY